MSAPAVSVVMTAHNRERYIAGAIESVLAQTFDDLELIVCDDGSSDRTVEIAEAYAAQDPRVRVVRNPANLGDYPNRNHAATFARGRYLKYHDSDDVMYPHCLSVMHGMLDAEPSAGFALSASGAWPGGPCPMLLTPEQAYQREYLGSGLFHLGPAAALFRTDVFRTLGGFPEVGAASDYVFWVRACRQVSVLLVPGDLFHWRVHPDQESVRETDQADKARVSLEGWLALSVPDCPLGPDDRLVARRNWTWIVVRGSWRHLRAGRFALAHAVWRHSGLSLLDVVRYLRRPRRSAGAGVPAGMA
ncbi:MAG: glycosyltransferase family 2 protein [Vicinamibacterales bacterium]